MNILIEEWQKSAKKVYDSETKLLLVVNTNEKQYERTYTYKYLAERQIQLLEQTRPNKNKNLEEQMNELQKEYYEYLKKVAETGEL